MLGQAGRQAGRQAGGQAGRQAGGLASRQAGTPPPYYIRVLTEHAIDTAVLPCLDDVVGDVIKLDQCRRTTSVIDNRHS